jgi:MFS family permease
VGIRALGAKPTGALGGRLIGLGAPYFLFLGVATLGSLGRASEAFLILRAREVGTLVALLPLLYMVSNITSALLSTPLGAVADRIGKRNTFTAGLLVFAGAYFGFAFGATTQTLWLLFVLYGFSLALTEGVGRAIVAGLVAEDVRATAFGLYSASTGLALLPASVVFGILAERFGSHVAFSYGAGLALIAAFGFLWLRNSR